MTLPRKLKAGLEALSGQSLEHVRVHVNSVQPSQLQSAAYAQGSQIHLAPGQTQHLAHAAWHVVPKRHGRVQPTTQLLGVAVDPGAALEKAADAMGARALQEMDKKTKSRRRKPRPSV